MKEKVSCKKEELETITLNPSTYNPSIRNSIKKGISIGVVLLFLGSVNAQETNRVACDTDFYATSLQKPTYGSSSQEITDYITKSIDFDEKSDFRRSIFEVNINCNGEIYSVRQINGGLTKGEKLQVESALLKMPKWSPARREETVNYQFFIEVKYKDEKLTVNTFMR